jgi:hypothetical protein
MIIVKKILSILRVSYDFEVQSRLKRVMMAHFLNDQMNWSGDDPARSSPCEPRG